MRTSRKHVLAALVASGVMGATSPVTLAAIEVAEDLLVNLDASALSPGSISSWANTGSLGGAFMNDFLAPNSDVFAGTVYGSTAAVFTGNDAMVSDIFAPAGVVGIDPTRSIEVWAYNPGIAGEEAMVTWAKRGQAGGPAGPDATGSAMQFNYGSSGAFGAATHWGAPDIGWGANGAPPAGTWHHLTYTFNGAEGGGTTPTTRVYIDGVEANSEVLAPGVINTHGAAVPYPFRLGAALAGNEANLEIFASLALARVRVHDGVLSPTQITNNFNEERSLFNTNPPEPPQARPLQRGPKHRYSFDGTGGDGAALTDSVGGAHGVLHAPDASVLTGSGQMSLVGGPSASAGYGDLPNNLISTLTELTLEAWVTPTAAQNWTRVADFGSTTEGEHQGPGGGGIGADYIFMSPTRGTNLNLKRAEIRDADGPTGARLSTADATVTTTAGEEQHYAVVYSSTSEFGVPELRLFVNGQLVSSTNTEITLSELNDVNNWLGRSNYTGDSNFQGLFEEFRIYDYALTAGELLGNFEAGANTINTASLWNRDANGNWSEAANWTGSVPNAADASALLGSAITAPRQIDLNVPVALGSLRFAGNHGYEVRGANGLTMDVAPGRAAVISASGPANHLISAPVTLADDTGIEVNTPTATLTLSNLAAAPAARLTKRGQGTLAVNRVRAAGLDVSGGTVKILTGGGQEGVSVVDDLTLAGATDNWTGTLDLADNDLIVRSDEANRAAVLSRIANQVKHARDTGTDGRWTGTGITSSNAAQDPITGLAAVLNPGMDTFAGQPVGPNDVLVKYTYNGDANLDGRINADDYFRIDSGFLDQPADPTYVQGDFNYDGTINADDYFLIDSAFLGQGAPITSGAAAAALASVPEPGGIVGVIMFAALATSRTLGKRCRRRREAPAT